jgi:hypothetical protein
MQIPNFMCASINDNSRFTSYIHPVLLQYHCCKHNDVMSSMKSGKIRKETGQLLGFGDGVVVSVRLQQTVGEVQRN